MTIIEFVEYMKKNTNTITREDQVLSMVKKQLDVKSYISIKEKRNLVDKIIDACILYDNGIYKFDGISKYVYFTMYTIAAYTNIELGEDIEEDFDMLSESKILPVILATIQNEYDDVNILLQMQCDSYLENNSVEAQFGKLFENVTNTLGSLESGLKDFIYRIPSGNFDVEKILNTLNNFGVGQGG